LQNQRGAHSGDDRHLDYWRRSSWADHRLAKAGHGVLVIEQDKHYVGGISRTVSYKGFLFDIGGHRFYSKSREVVALWNEILPDDFLDRPRLSRIYYAGKFYA
jgi:protoporphyrinogen oxidase